MFMRTSPLWPHLKWSRTPFLALFILTVLLLAPRALQADRLVYSGPLELSQVSADAPAAAEGALPKSRRSDDELLILQMLLGDITLTDAMIGYAANGSLILPLSEFVNILDFPIKVDSENGRASGWFISENRLFSLDLASGQAVIGGTRQALEPGMIELLEGDIFVDVRTLARWFPIDIRFDISNLQVALVSREPLPIEQRLEREGKREKVLARKSIDGPPLKPLDVPYEWATFPVSDTTIEITANRDEAGETTQGRRQSTQMSLDLGKMNADVFLSGDDQEQFRQARVKLGRKDPRARLFGPMQATEFSLGDIDTPQVPLVARTKVGRGFQIANVPLDQPTEFDRITLTGDLAAGWEVEIYRNEVLLDFAVSQNDGRYRFEDVPLLFGVNVLKLVFYGPQGQKREKVRQVRVGSDQIKPGDHQYRFGISQQDTQLVLGDSLDTTDASLQGRTRYFIDYQTGVTRDFSVGANFTSIPFEGGHREYLGLTGVASLGPVFGRVDLVRDLTRGMAATLSAQTSLFGTSVIFEHTALDGFVSERFAATDDPLSSLTKLRFDGAVALPFAGQMPFSIDLEHERSESRQRVTSLSNRLSGAIGRASLSHTTGFNLTETPGSDDITTIDGTALVSSSLFDVRVRASLGYTLKPIAEMTTASATADWTLNEYFNGRAGVTKELTGAGLTTYSAGVNSTLPWFALGLNLDYSDNDVVSGRMTATYSWGYDAGGEGIRLTSKPSAERGVMTARVFRDLNVNGKWDEGVDEAIKGARFTANGDTLDARTNEDGVAFIPEIDTYKPVDFKVAQGSLENPFWLAEPEGVSVVLRPGAPGHVDFPVVSTGEVDGTVFRRVLGKDKQVSDVVIQLVDAEGRVAKQVKSAFDGFYLLDYVKPGSYRVRLDPEQMKRLNLRAPPEHEVVISGEGTIVAGKDFIIGSNGADADPAATPVPSSVPNREPRPEPRPSPKPKPAPATQPAPPAQPKPPVKTEPLKSALRQQLTTFETREFAELAWAGLEVEHAQAISGLKPLIVEDTQPAGTVGAAAKVFRLYAGPLASEAAAQALCSRIRAARGGAWCDPSGPRPSTWPQPHAVAETPGNGVASVRTPQSSEAASRPSVDKASVEP